MDDKVKETCLKEGIVEAVLETLEVATAEIGSAQGGDSPYGGLLQSALIPVNNLAVGSAEVKEAFARQATRTAAVLHHAACLPLPSAGCKDVVPGGAAAAPPAVGGAESVLSKVPVGETTKRKRKRVQTRVWGR